MTTQDSDIELPEENKEEAIEPTKIPPVAQKVSRFGPQSMSKFGK